MGESAYRATFIIVGSSTKQYPTIFIVSPDRHRYNGAPCPASWSQLRSVMLDMAHISRAALFPCPSHFGVGLSGTAHLSCPYLDLESPNVVLT